MTQKNLSNDMWTYKNFKIGGELEIAGNLIYDGMRALNQLKNTTQQPQLFSFLYYTSIGIERVQKVIIALAAEISDSNYENFEKELITHSHVDLQSRIKQFYDFDFDKRINEFLSLITKFYKTARYNRFCIYGSEEKERKLVEDFILKYIPDKQKKKDVLSDSILITEDVKELFGRIIGKISNKYYQLVCKGCDHSGTYTYEFAHQSNAAKIFLSQHNKNSLQIQTTEERIAMKELLVYLVNTTDQNAFLRFLRDIQPLAFDSYQVNEYLENLYSGDISSSLVDEVDFLYGEESYSIDRSELVDLIGNTNVLFEYPDIEKCYRLLDDLINKKCNCKAFAEEFPAKILLIDDDSIKECLADVPRLCDNYLKEIHRTEECSQQFIKAMEKYHQEFSEYIIKES